MFSTERAPAIAGLYWLLVVAVFLLLQRLGFNMTGYGSAPVILLTMPWSLCALLTWQFVELLPYGADLLRPLNTALGMCVLFPVLCGGLNTILILATASAMQRRRRHRR